MQIKKKSISALLVTTITMAPVAVSPASRYNDIVKTIFSHFISNVPGKSLIASQVGDQPEPIYRTGECWYETPGAHHLIGRNASKREPAKLLAVFIADAGDDALTTPDQAGGSR
jgi:hypothetical protein